MVRNLIKWQLITLVLVSFVVVFYVYFAELLPDHVLRITSDSDSINYFTFLSASLLALVYYYTGFWVAILAIVEIALFISLYRKNDHPLAPLLTVIHGYTLCTLLYMVFPQALGDGLSVLVNNWSIDRYLFLSLVLTLPASFYLLAPGFFNREMLRGFQWTAGLIKAFGGWSLAVTQSLWQRLRPATPHKAQEQEVVAPAETPWSEEQEESEEEENLLTSQKIDDETLQQETLVREPEPAPPVGEKRKRRSLGVKLGSRDLIASINPRQKKPNLTPEESYFVDIIRKIEDKLAEFKINAKIINVLKGPVVDTFELELGTGIKVSKVNSITEDLSLALCGSPIRLVYPLAGRSTMGIEVPRSPREIIYLDEVLASESFLHNKASLPLCLGKDAYGEAAVVDLAKMPHMLIAGATGAGKSVFINTVLVSLLVKKSPEEMKLVLIDPKQLELALYAELPHLALPVITDGQTASIALMWACQEMERRYSIMKALGVRSLASYNEKIQQMPAARLRPIDKYFTQLEDKNYELPLLVIIIDEFADLILTKSGKEIENNVCRLAAKARAAGIHLILATQRPSVDVITGLIKSNFPTRVSFKVTSNVDSRTILSAQGAEKLLGMGDMLYKHGIEMKRLHSAYVDEKEIESLMEKLSGLPHSFDEGALSYIEERKSAAPEDESEFRFTPNGHFSVEGEGEQEDDKFHEAVQVVTEHRKASASFLQRRLGVGYNRAANLIEQMEQQGIVGPQQGSKPRDVLFSAKRGESFPD